MILSMALRGLREQALYFSNHPSFHLQLCSAAMSTCSVSESDKFVWLFLEQYGLKASSHLIFHNSDLHSHRYHGLTQIGN